MVVKCPELHHLSDNLKQTRENKHVPVRAVPRVPLRPVQVRRIRKVKDRTTSVNEMIKTKIRNRSLVSLCYSSLLKWKFEDENSLEINYIDINNNICCFFSFSGGKLPNPTDKMRREPSTERSKKESEGEKEGNFESDEEVTPTEG